MGKQCLIALLGVMSNRTTKSGKYFATFALTYTIKNQRDARERGLVKSGYC